MRRLIGGLAVLTVLVGGGPMAWAQNVDPLHIGDPSPGAAEGSFIADEAAGTLQFLVAGSPDLCNDGSDATDCPRTAHLYFYTAACNRVDDALLPLTANDVAVVELHNPLTTSVRAGNVLLAASDPGIGLDVPVLADNQLIGIMYHFDVNRGIARAEEMARLSNNSGNGWSPYKPAHVLLLAPPDDGAQFFVTLLVKCPTGTALQAAGAAGGTVIGTQGTLGGDMLDLAAQDEGDAPLAAFAKDTTGATSSTICDDCDTNGRFASNLSALIFDTEENFLRSVDNLPCRCLGVAPQGAAFQNETRISTLSAITATQATYWELLTFGGSAGDELFSASLNIRVQAGGKNFNLFHRLFNANDRDNLVSD